MNCLLIGQEYNFLFALFSDWLEKAMFCFRLVGKDDLQNSNDFGLDFYTTSKCLLRPVSLQIQM